MKFNFYAFLCLLLTSCAHLSKEQCLTTDWKYEGYKDGLVGKSPRSLNSEIKDCAKFGIDVKTENYQNGWHTGALVYCHPSSQLGFEYASTGREYNTILERNPVCNIAGVQIQLIDYARGYKQGLKTFCTYENGWSYGKQGKNIPTLCPPLLSKKFNAGWSEGQKSLCNDSSNAFALGKNHQAYPANCNGNLYPGFKSEYDRGYALADRINDLQNSVNQLNKEINSKASRHFFKTNSSGEYVLGIDTTDEAKQALKEVNNLLNQKHHTEKELLSMRLIH